MCYPLRLTGQETAAERTAEGRRETRGGSARKWEADEPVPWPNYYWVSVDLRRGLC